jgi:serine/arginine repetitive matrix protein 2
MRLEEDEIERKVDELRSSLLDDLKKQEVINAKKLRASDTHGLAAAKKLEIAKMAQALGTRKDYEEGDAFNKDKQAELREQRIAQRQEAEERRAVEKQKYDDQKAKWAAEQ